MVWFWQKTLRPTAAELLRDVTAAIEQVQGRSAGTAVQPIQPAHFLGADLGLSSLAFARLAGILQKRCGRGPLPFYTLFLNADGTLLHDIRVADLTAFLERHLRVNEA